MMLFDINRCVFSTRSFYFVLFAGGRRKWNTGTPFCHRAKYTSSEATKTNSTSLPLAGEAFSLFSLQFSQRFTIVCFSLAVYGGALCAEAERLRRSNPIHTDTYGLPYC